MAALSAFVLLLVIPYFRIPDPGNYIRNGLIALFVLGATWAILAILGRVFERIMPKDRSVAATRSTWKVVSYVTWFVVLIILVFSFLGDVANTALGIGLLGAAFTFAMQKPLLSFVGWIIVTYSGLYRIGDRVELGGVKGYVLDVGLQTTDPQEFGGWMPGDEYTGRIVTVPNNVIFDGPTCNYTRDFPLVWDDVEISVTYESNIDVAKEIAISTTNEVVGGIMFENYDRYRQQLAIRDLEDSLLRTPEVRLAFEASGVKLSVIYLVPAESRGSIRTRIIEKLWRRFSDDRRVALAYPHVQVVDPHKDIVSGKTPDWIVPPTRARP